MRISGTSHSTVALILWALCTLSITAAQAHQFAPALLELTEITPTQSTVRWKQPLVRVQGSALRPVLPPQCRGIGRPDVNQAGTGVVATWRLDCANGLVGLEVGVEGIASSRADVLLRVTLEDGRTIRHVLTAESPIYQIAGQEGKLQLLQRFLALGFKHILSGWDHLAFVFGLLLLVGFGSALLWTITAFTVGHSITLALATLGIVKAPVAWIEAAIALSIYLLAVAIVRHKSGHTSLMHYHPWLVAGGFGLLHGMGFAGALTEIGLPAGDIPLTLFSFNLGIELGQIVFVAALAAIIGAFRKIRSASQSPWMQFPAETPWMQMTPAYVIGSLGIFWFLQRTLGALGYQI